MGADHPSIAFVVPRYGPEVLGGAETLCRELAEHLASRGAPVDVLTTCALDHFTWDDHFPPGTVEASGVSVRRFPVSERDPAGWWALHTQIASGVPVSYSDQLQWMGNSVWSEGLLEAACDTSRYDWVVCVPYLFGTTYWVSAERRGRTALVPCLHDEAHARQAIVRECLEGATGCMVNAHGEGHLLAKLAPGARQRMVGVGFDDAPPPSPAEIDEFCRRRGVAPGYLLYAGRREEAKGLPDLFSHYDTYRRVHPDAPKLALMGTGDLRIPDHLVDSTIDLGFVSIEERAAGYGAASVLLHPSRLESLGMVLMEAWLAGTPALVNASSDVLREHCGQSGGGLWFQDEAEFCEALDVLLTDPALRRRLAIDGAAYSQDVFSWAAVERRFYDAIETWS